MKNATARGHKNSRPTQPRSPRVPVPEPPRRYAAQRTDPGEATTPSPFSYRYTTSRDLTGRRAAERYAGWLERDGLEVAARIGGTALRAALDNAALYRIAIVRQRHHPAAKAFLARKINEGKTPREARRALKRHLANIVYRRLLACRSHASDESLLT